jgi:hemerythrin
MHRFEFSAEMETGNSDIDFQHRTLFAMANEVLFSIELTKSPEQFQRAVNFLVAYLEYHFSSQELAMRQHRYASRRFHSAFHDHIRREARTIAARSSSKGNMEETKSAIFFLLEDWAVYHVSDADRLLADFLLEQSPGEATAGLSDIRPMASASGTPSPDFDKAMLAGVVGMG